MAIVATKERPSGSSEQGIDQPYAVRDDTDAELSQADAVAAALAQFNLDYPLIVNNYENRFEQTAKQSWNVWFFETKRTNTPDGGIVEFQVPTARTRFNFHAKPKYMKIAFGEHLDNVDPLAFIDTWQGLMNVKSTGSGYQVAGATINPPSPNVSFDLFIPNLDMAQGSPFLQSLQGCMGKINKESIGTADTGELFLVSVTGQQRTEDDWQLNIGISVSPLVEHRIGDNIVVPTNDHFYTWTFDRPGDHEVEGFIGEKVFSMQPYMGITNQVWKFGDWSWAGEIANIEQLLQVAIGPGDTKMSFINQL